MPLGWERFNEKIQRPNAAINFIRPLPGADQKLSQDFLERVAAIVHPIMKRHHLLINALEEFPWNRDFAGRNFNAGEVVQLVLRARNGAWLPFRHVQMVMVHELAHCVQMNHSRAFWKVRDGFADELRALWTRGYTGEGLWGRGRTLLSGAYTTEAMPDAAMVPEHVCGGTYRSAGRKRKREGKGPATKKPKASPAEQKPRRTVKRFGTGGRKLGAVLGKRTEVEGKTGPAKSRVGSARLRELSAAAAIARLAEAEKEEEAKRMKEQAEVVVVSDDDSETESELEEDDVIATDADGNPLKDSKGRGLVKICETEDNDDADSKREMEEFRRIDRHSTRTPEPSKNAFADADETGNSRTDGVWADIKRDRDGDWPSPCTVGSTSRGSEVTPDEQPDRVSCKVCSYLNPWTALTCEVCLNVLKPAMLISAWRCQTASCLESGYINPGDAGVCGACGASKKQSTG